MRKGEPMKKATPERNLVTLITDKTVDDDYMDLVFLVNGTSKL